MIPVVVAGQEITDALLTTTDGTTRAVPSDNATPAPKSQSTGGNSGADDNSASAGNEFSQELFFSADDSMFSLDGRNAGFDSSQWENQADEDDQASWLKLFFSNLRSRGTLLNSSVSEKTECDTFLSSN